MLVHEFLEHSADRLPDKVALVCDGQRLTYTELDRRANQLANALRSCGIGRGERVVTFLPNSVELVISIFGILKAGAVFVVANHTTKPAKLAYILANCQASAFITSARNQVLAEGLAQQAPSVKLTILSDGDASSSYAPATLTLPGIIAHESVSRPAPVNIDLDLACLIYTSGSTGDPKGVMSDHSNMVFAASSITEYLQNVEDDIVIDVLPLSFDYGLYQLLMVTKFGGTLVLERGFAYPAAVLKLIEKERVTGLPGVPTIFAVLLQTDLSHYDLSSLRYVTNTAAALPPSHVLKLREKFPWARLYSMYGLTETKRTLYLPPEQVETRPGSVGIAIPGTEVWLVDDEGTRLGPGQSGELVVRGRHVMRGYWGDPVASAARFRPGALPNERLCYTGDLFKMDEEGFLYFVARKDDIIKSRGEKVAPKEVENALYSLDGVLEAAVVGVPDPMLGQAIAAYLVVSTPLSAPQVLAHCRSNLEDFMVPKFVYFCDELPKTTSGKIKRSDLRAPDATPSLLADAPTAQEA